MNFNLVRRMAMRDIRSGEMGLLLVALIVAVGTVTSISLFVDRLGQALMEESANFLAADRQISSSRAIPEDFRDQARKRDLDVAETMVFPSMVFAGDTNQLVSVKAVAGTYPLRGKLIVSDTPFERGYPIEDIPPPGEVWLDSRLFPALGVSLGTVDLQLQLLPLIGSSVQVDRLVVSGLAVFLEKDADGRANWVFETAAAKGEGEPEPAPAPSGEGGLPISGLSLGDVRIEGARFSYIDMASGQTIEASDFNLKASLPSLEGKLAVDGGLTVNDQAIKLALGIDSPGSLLSGNPASLGRAVIFVGDIAIETTDVSSAVAQARAIVEARGGYVFAQELGGQSTVVSLPSTAV